MEMKTIAAAFIKAKKEFSPAMKTSTNPHFKSKYADLAACVEAVDDAFLNNGIVMYQETFEDDSGVTVETVLLHESGETIRCGKLHVPASKQDPQGYGSALSYARRYSLMAACGIAPEDDDGNAASKQPPKQSRPASIQNTEAPKPTFTSERMTAIQVAVEASVDAYKVGNISAAHDYIYGLKDNEEIGEAWGKLKEYSGMRSAIKKYREENVTNQKEAA